MMPPLFVGQKSKRFTISLKVFLVMLVHPNIDPVAFSIGPVSVHWYGIMYLLAFATAWWLALRLAKRPGAVLNTKQVEDLIVYGALGVVLGGRIGYVFFYNFGTWIQDPLWLFRVWEGGMSFHGGLLGVILSTYIYCRRIGVAFYDMLDFVAVITPLGLGFGRIGNFIGQELWGRQTDVPWGMVFPKDIDKLVRHPSQLYQAFLEGLVLFCIVYWFARKSRPRLAVGGLFILCYGIFRFVVEFVREPDEHLKSSLLFEWMTRGQLLSLPMILGGIAILCWAYTRGFGEGLASTSPDIKTEKSTEKKSKKSEKKLRKSKKS
jgi:phosphatidylglycerol:prolipoprotein diacylglycerol transferase